MIAILQWTTLAVCALVAIFRVPSALRGENRSIFGIFALSTFAIMLSINAVYLPVDAWLGSQNYTNLILRFLIYGVVLLSGYKIAKGFDAQRSVRLIVGPVGVAVLGLVVVATVVPFLLANTAGSSTGLSALPDQSANNVDLIRLYTVAGRFYPSFVAACLLPATIRTIRSGLPRLPRSGAAVLAVGSSAMILLSLSDLLPRHLAYLQYFISSTAILGLILGLTLMWLSRVLATKRPARR
ncbi:hypothetical protein NicSoilB4_06630 [Arthrobacter sp. NicSoilB4]|uniref:hypothetical protein n=1 Tax=Arthrobacter sp. NicSoilB4 TaxID=2830997 RepID=UPI001CC3EBCC|nr:hypothetical protein [Arthrobacter sp. NicSoilB4]BCW65900.1 hypothetical protein NicSoilB4_06630 [Arthrobacter sp. NicSoilB4]